ncbi:unnamed protein product [marine sediment metagenome]|uniref:Uncharacterized protein n=1 Tax=marine sediment metagenome TaxID=412755 RepID=X1D4Q4_9ZZZZ
MTNQKKSSSEIRSELESELFAKDEMSTRNVDELDNSLIAREIKIGIHIPIVSASIR